MPVSPLRNIYESLKTILIGMRVTLKYNFARTVTVQYPDAPPTLQPRFRGFHWYLIEKCTACKACVRACPVDCIYVENTGPRKMDKETGTARGGAMTRWAVDYSKCMFCALCVDACAMECLGMGDVHDNSVYNRQDTVVEFTELAKQGLRTPQPIWMRKATLPPWVAARKEAWEALARPAKDEMRKSLSEQPVAKPAPAAAPAKPASETSAPPAADAAAEPPAA